MSTARAPKPRASVSPAMMWNGLVVVGGQTGRHPVTGQLPRTLEEQVDQAISNLEAVLAAAGCGLTDVLKTTCLLVDMADFPVMEAVYARRFPRPCPARTSYGVTLGAGLLFEIEAWAVVPVPDPAP
ncbi:RidA family protein [Micromonospora sp. NPDC048830]|uniref:RidA family protein n=1 Tax=Micromonospora sp. NPDC048830 TaxID=3364257 RepID=UPI00371DE92F